jgi:hypothetical protein
VNRVRELDIMHVALAIGPWLALTPILRGGDLAFYSGNPSLLLLAGILGLVVAPVAGIVLAWRNRVYRLGLVLAGYCAVVALVPFLGYLDLIPDTPAVLLVVLGIVVVAYVPFSLLALAIWAVRRRKWILKSAVP